MIQILKLKALHGAYLETEWECEFEFPLDASLEELHFAIQYLVDFGNDHMFEFYTSRTFSSRGKIRYEYEEDNINDTTVAQLLTLPKNHKAFYYFDYGDSWVFQVSKSRKKPRPLKDGDIFPILLSEKGTKPEQYGTWDE